MADPDLIAYLRARYGEAEAAAQAALAEAETMHPPLTWRWAVVDSWTSSRMPPGAPSPADVRADLDRAAAEHRVAVLADHGVTARVARSLPVEWPADVLDGMARDGQAAGLYDATGGLPPTRKDARRA